MSLADLDICGRRAPAVARSLRDGFLELMWPTRCIGCDMPGELLCPDCRSSLPLIDAATACPRCGAPHGSIVCTECWTGDGAVDHAFARAACALEFEDVAARMIVAFKDAGELRAADVIAPLIARAVADAQVGELDALVPVPASPAALLRRGYDHMDLVATPLAGLLGVGRLDMLRANDVADQRGLGRGQRGENMRGAFALAENELPPPRRVLLVDDVLTTGATLDAAAAVLLDGGVGEVVAAAACRVW